MRALLPGVGAIVSICALSACGQQGPLFLPTEPAAANRATLPETLRPGTLNPPSTAPAPTSPVSPASSPSAP